MSKTVVLARLHPFIVAEMKPFLEQAGYSVARLENPNDLAALARSSKAAVISLAVSSSLGKSAGEIFMQLRQGAPQVPVLFAAMLALDKLECSLQRIARKAGVQANILGVAAANENIAILGKPDTFLYISKDDLADAPRRAIAARMVQRHFR